MSTLSKILGLVILGVCLAVVGSYTAGSYLISPAHTDTEPKPPEAEAVQFNSKNGRISGWLSSTEDPIASVLLLHGVRSNKSSMRARIELANSLKLNALAIDLQAHGESEGSTITFGHLESHDVSAAVEYLRGQSEMPIFVVGVSLGGAAALLSNPPIEVNGMILEAVYPNISKAISNRLEMRVPYGGLATPLLTVQLSPRLGISISQLSPEQAAHKVTVPVAILNGTLDEQTTTSDARKLFAAFQTEKRLEFFRGARHVDLQAFDPKHYKDIFSRFISEHLPDDA